MKTIFTLTGARNTIKNHQSLLTDRLKYLLLARLITFSILLIVVTAANCFGHALVFNAACPKVSFGGDDPGIWAGRTNAANNIYLRKYKGTDLTGTVELMSFQVFQYGNTIKALWTTAQETKLQKFEVERSDDGNTFYEVIVVAAKNEPTNNYSWTDEDFFQPLNYYRLKMIHADGAVTYSKTMQVLVTNNKGDAKLFVSVNNSRVLIVQLPFDDIEKNYSVNVFDASGELVYQFNIARNGTPSLQSYTLPDNVGQGKYVVTLKAGSYLYSQKISVE